MNKQINSEQHIKLNIELSRLLTQILTEIEYIIDDKRADRLVPLLKQAKKLVHEINYPTSMTRYCSICDRLNPDDANVCAYCGTSLIITRVRQQDDNTRKSDRTEP